MTIEEKMVKSEVRVFKNVFPDSTNHYDTLIGGVAMHLMDEVAFIAATRFSRKRMVTVSSDKIDFKHPIPASTIIEIIAIVDRVGTTSLNVKVDIYVEKMYSESREKAISGNFTFVAIDTNRKPIPILD